MAANEAARLTAQLSDANWEKRSDAFYGLVQLGAKGEKHARVGPSLSNLLRDLPGKAEEIKRALTKTLETENELVKASAELVEEFSDYYGDLLSAVTSLRDPRSIKGLSEAMGTGHMVTRTLASFGEAAMNPVLEKLRTEGGVSKQGAAIVLGRLLDPDNPASIKDPASREKIKVELKKAAQDMAGAYIRAAAVEGLAKLKDPEIVSFLTDIARKDGYDASQFVGKPGSFPVREAATAGLLRLGQDGESATGKNAVDALGKLSQEGPAPVRSDAVDALVELAASDPNASRASQDAASRVLRKLNLGLARRTETKSDSKTETKGQEPATPPQR